MCDHIRDKKTYRNINYCEKCGLVLGPVYKVGHIREFKHGNLKSTNSVLDIFENDMKLKIKNDKSLENAVF